MDSIEFKTNVYFHFMKLTRVFLLTFLLLFSFSGICLDNSIRTEISRHIATGDYASAQSYIELELLKPHDKQTKKDLNQSLVSVLIYSSKYKKALEVAFATIDAMSPEDDRSDFYFLIGCIFYAVEDYQKSTEYLHLSLSSKIPSDQVKALLMLSEIYLQTDQKDKVLETLENATKIAAEFELAPQTEDHIEQQYNFHAENYEICKTICSKIIADSTNFLNTRCNAFSVFGDCLVAQDSLVKASEYYELALELTIETADPDLIKTTSWKLIEVYEKLGLQDKANGYHKIYNNAINDSAYFSIDKYRELYQLEQERHIQSVSDKKKQTAASNNWLLYTILILTSGILLYFILRKNRNKQSQKEVHLPTPAPAKKIQINPIELKRIKEAVNQFIAKEKYLQPKITLKSFCEENGITSERYLSQFVNDHYKKSFSNFVNDLRIEFAFNRIKTDHQFRNYKIEIMAKECGFGSRKTFERVFQTKYDQSPSDYANNC